MFKKLTTLVMAAALCMGLAVPAFAAYGTYDTSLTQFTVNQVVDGVYLDGNGEQDYIVFWNDASGRAMVSWYTWLYDGTTFDDGSNFDVDGGPYVYNEWSDNYGQLWSTYTYADTLTGENYSFALAEKNGQVTVVDAQGKTFAGAYLTPAECVSYTRSIR